MTDDAQLLRQYVDTNSEGAFNQLVERHIALVYHSALRQLADDSHLAQDITQEVFLLLAERARALCDHPSLAGWLHATAHFKVSAARRSERRRRLREVTALAMGTVLADSPSGAEWERIRPILDEVVLELSEGDREAVLLRFFEGQALSEIGVRLHLTEKGAFTRVDRALGRLRERLARRGISSSAAALAVVLGGQVSLAAPAELVPAVTNAVMASSGPAAFVSATIQIMSTMKVTLGVATVAIGLAGVVATREIRASQQSVAALTAANQQNDALSNQLQVARQRVAKAEQDRARSAPISAKSASQDLIEKPPDGRAFLKVHPDVKQALLAEVRAYNRAEYGALFKSLGLNQDQIEQFLDIIVSGTRHSLGKFDIPLSDSPPTQPEYTSELRNLLGRDGFRQFRTYEKMAPARALPTELATALYFTPNPLTVGQASQLTQITTAALSNPALNPRNDGGPLLYMPPAVWDAVIAQTPGLLSETQLAAVKDIYQQAIEMQARSKAISAYYQEARRKAASSN